MSMEVIVTIVSRLGLITYLRDVNNLYRGEITQLLSTMDIPVVFLHIIGYLGGWATPLKKKSQIGSLHQGSGWKWKNIFELPPPS